MAIGNNILPSMDRIKGKHIAEYAKKLKGSDRYNRQFSSYNKNHMTPEDLPKHFDEAKEKIAADYGMKKIRQEA